MENTQKGQFNSNFGFLMASLGSAVGLGNLWSFPYKMGIGGGFAFLLIYAILCVVVGYPLVLSEIALGRKTQKAAIEAYTEADSRFRFNGILQTAVPFFLVSFYCTFGGYITLYLCRSIVALFSSEAYLNTGDPGTMFGEMLGSPWFCLVFMLIFLALTVGIVIGGISGGIEKFCKIAMPALAIMLVIIAVRTCTLDGASAGLAFMFSPDFSLMSSVSGFLDILSLAGGQMFFSLSLASGCLVAYGSYLDRKENLEFDAFAITLGDSAIAILAGVAIMPAVFAFGIDPGAGPSLLFVSMTTVFQSMGGAGRVFQFIFWLLVFFAALSSSIGMLEGGISAILDSRIKSGKTANRTAVALIVGAVALVGNFITTLDGLGETSWMAWCRILGQPDFLDVLDCVAEGLLMPITGLIMAILLGWVIPHYLDDEIGRDREFKTKGFYNFCLKWLGPLFMIFIVYGQIMSFWG